MNDGKQQSESVRSLCDIYEILNRPSSFHSVMCSVKQLEEESMKGNAKAIYTLKIMYQFELFIKFITTQN